jgi:hypothetical protein
MWGAERGSIPINHQTNFGNVLPNSIRQFQFAWRSDVSLYDMGRYRAVATLAYGEDEQFFTHSTAYFWVIPFKQVALVLLVLGTSIGLLVMLVRMYVRRMLSLAGIDASPVQRGRSVSHTSHELPLRKGRAVKTVIVSQYEQATAPVRFEFAAVIKMLQGRAPRQYGALIARYVWEKRVIALACIGVLLGVGLIVGFIVVVSSAVRSYEVTIFTGGSEIVLSDEELRYNELRQSAPLAEELLSSTTVKVVNVSGVVGLGAEARIFLEDKKIPVTALSSEGDRKERKNVVVFHPDDQEAALEISKLLDGALLSANAAQESGSVTVLVGYEFTRQ